MQVECCRYQRRRRGLEGRMGNPPVSVCGSVGSEIEAPR